MRRMLGRSSGDEQPGTENRNRRMRSPDLTRVEDQEGLSLTSHGTGRGINDRGVSLLSLSLSLFLSRVS